MFTNERDKEFHYIAAIENNEILGLRIWLVHGLAKHGLFELDKICILRNSKGKGTGEKLVDALIEDSRKLYLFTDEDNTNTHLFYEKLGFKHESTLKDHYYKNQDERVHTIFL